MAWINLITMTPHLIFNLIILFIVLDFALDRVLSWLNVKNWKPEIPDEMNEHYNAEKYEKARSYEIAGSKFGLISSAFSLVVILVMLYLEGFAWLDGYARSITENTYFLTMIYFAVLMIASDIIDYLPKAFKVLMNS